MVEKSLIELCIINDQKAFELLYNQTIPYMVVLCRKYYVAESDLEDVLQEIYSEMFVSLKRYDENKGAFIPWFRKLGLFIILKGYRKKKMKYVDINDYEQYFPAEVKSLEEFESPDILAEIEKLPVGYKTIFKLAIDGLDHSEISNFLGISKSTSRSQLARAKQILRKQITNLKCNVQ